MGAMVTWCMGDMGTVCTGDMVTWCMSDMVTWCMSDLALGDMDFLHIRQRPVACNFLIRGPQQSTKVTVTLACLQLPR